MGKRIVKDMDVHVIRATKSSLKSIADSKTKGLFYYIIDGKYVLVDNRTGKMLTYECETPSQFSEHI